MPVLQDLDQGMGLHYDENGDIILLASDKSTTILSASASAITIPLDVAFTGSVTGSFDGDLAGNTLTDSVNGEIEMGATAHFGTEEDNGDSGAADTIDWTVNNKQKSTLTANCTYTFSDPGGACSLIFKLVQGGIGSYTVTWPAAVQWTGATPPTLSTAIGAVDVVTFYFDGTAYHGQAMLDSQ